MQIVSPNAACPGLHWKPLDAAIGQLLTLYHPGGRQGDSKQTMMKKCTNFAGHFDGCGGALICYFTHCLMEKVQSFGKSHWTLPSGEYCGDRSHWTYQHRFFFSFFIDNL
jgi:hypothetical protein